MQLWRFFDPSNTVKLKWLFYKALLSDSDLPPITNHIITGLANAIGRALAFWSIDPRLTQLEIKNKTYWGKRSLCQWQLIVECLFRILTQWNGFKIDDSDIYWMKGSLTLSHCVKKGYIATQKLALWCAWLRQMDTCNNVMLLYYPTLQLTERWLQVTSRLR